MNIYRIYFTTNTNESTLVEFLFLTRRLFEKEKKEEYIHLNNRENTILTIKTNIGIEVLPCLNSLFKQQSEDFILIEQQRFYFKQFKKSYCKIYKFL